MKQRKIKVKWERKEQQLYIEYYHERKINWLCTTSTLLVWYESLIRVRIYNNLEYFQYIRGTKIYDVFIAHRHDI